MKDAFPEFQLERAGDGGMKSAFRILDGGQRVLKLVREPLPEVDEGGAISLPERIRREVEGMEQFSHRGVVKVLDGPDVREVDGRLRVWYIEPLYDKILRDTIGVPWSESRCLDLMQDLAEAAEVLQVGGVVHRDIKPSNIALDDEDRPVLLDLGIALFHDLTPLTDDWGQSPKTPQYAAPEQFALRRDVSIDFRTDMYQIGIVVFEALTGKHPFAPEDPARYLDRIFSGRWDEVAIDGLGISDCMIGLLRRLLDPAVGRRYRRFAFLFEAIEECR